MQVLMLELLFTLLLLAVSFNGAESQRFASKSWRPEHYIPETTGCVFGDRVYQVGARWSPRGQCVQYTCEKADSVVFQPCPRQHGSINGYQCDELPGNPQLPYPACCPSLNCKLYPDILIQRPDNILAVEPLPGRPGWSYWDNRLPLKTQENGGYPQPGPHSATSYY